MRCLLLCCFVCFFAPLSGQQTERIYLSGKDKDQTVDWEFYCDKGRKNGYWTTIPVPAHWEQAGFGSYNYGQDPAAEHSDETGRYRFRFTPDRDLRGKYVNLVFDGVMTDATVRLNGKSVGPTHRGAFYRFRYPISDFLLPGEENLLEVDVSKQSTDASVNAAERQADYWIFGGIYRPVWLEVLPEAHLRQVSVDARGDGTLRVVAERQASRAGNQLEVIVRDPAADRQLFRQQTVFSAGKSVTLTGKVADILPWSAEFPHRYELTVRLLDGEHLLHERKEMIGFRTVELRPHDGLYVNGVKIRLKGVNRHCFWPESGRTLSKEVDVNDAVLIKEMNMNAVRMSHYPPDPSFLEAADSLGLYIIDELAGWQDAYRTEAGTPLVKELVERDVNHPSVILWSNGNEGGHNHALRPLYARYDPQERTVIHPWGIIDHTDTQHYRSFGCCAGTLFNGTEVFFPTEMQHGMYDGGHGAGLDELWEAMYHHPLSAGGFLWNLADEGIVRTDQDGFIDTHGNFGADGILGPHREKEGSFYTIREVWSPVHIETQPLRAGSPVKIKVENRYHRTDLKGCTFARALVRYGPPEGGSATEEPRKTIPSPRLAPGLSAYLDPDLPADWTEYDALNLYATDPHGKAIMEWTFPIRTPAQIADQHITDLPVRSQPSANEDGDFLHVTAGKVKVSFSLTDGQLAIAAGPGGIVPFSGGPFLDTDSTIQFRELTWEPTEEGLVVTPLYSHGLRSVEWLVRPDGMVRLRYTFVPRELKKYQGTAINHIGVNFRAPEEGLSGVEFLGAGPYRVYKNRLKGPRLGRYHKPYNDAITGLVWQYPEFKGFFRNFYWARFRYEHAPFTVFSGTENLLLRLFTPKLPADARPGVRVTYPAGDVSFMHAIPPVGTKFKSPDQLGPAGMPNQYRPPYTDNKLFTGTLYFQFW